MNTSRRQESGSHSVTACIFPFKIPPSITYLPRAQYSWSARDQDTPQAVPSQAPGLRHIFISSAIPGASSSAHRLHHPTDWLQTKGEVLPPAYWHGLGAICLHLESLPDGQDLVLKHYFTLTYCLKLLGHVFKRTCATSDPQSHFQTDSLKTLSTASCYLQRTRGE